MEQAGRLNSWKEIAAHLGVSPRTAQRWEKTEGLPARRHKHEVLSSVFAYTSDIETWWNSRPDLKSLSNAPPPARSIAVLPFTNLDRDEEDEILSDGITEELISVLSRVQGLHVVARTSAFHFKGRTDDIRSVASKLGVNTVLEGSLRRSGDRLRITAQLINAVDGYHLWSERFDRRLIDILDLQDEIATAIVGALQMTLGVPRMDRRRGLEGELYELYLEGRYHCHRRTVAGFLRAVECFEKILARNARAADAWAGLAECHTFLAPLAGIPFEEAIPRAKTAAAKALEIDASLPDPHCSLGFLLAVFDYDWARSEAHFLEAIKLQPEHANSHLWYGGHLLAAVGRLDEAAEHARRACELDPLSPSARSGVGGSWIMSRQPDRAISACNQALDLEPAHPIALRFLGEAWLLKDRMDEATSTFSRIEPPVIAAGFLGYCYARNGHPERARKILANLERMSSPSPALQAALVSLGLGERNTAFDWLRKACVERSMCIHWLKTEPVWDPLRSDPRFPALLRELHLCG